MKGKEEAAESQLAAEVELSLRWKGGTYEQRLDPWKDQRTESRRSVYVLGRVTGAKVEGMREGGKAGREVGRERGDGSGN